MYDPMKSGLDSFAALMQFWTDLGAKTMRATMNFSPESAPQETVREIRSAMFDAWAKAWEDFVRTPAFLNMMRSSMSIGTQSRKDMLAFFDQWQKGVMGFGDSAAAPAVATGQQFQEQIMAGMDAVTSQLKRLSRRLDSLEQDIEEEREAGRTRRARKKAAGKRATD